MDRFAFLNLLQPVGQEAIQAALHLDPRERDFLHHYQSLSRHYPPELARAALEIAIFRHDAKGKFPFAEKMYFCREALEQASPWEVSTYRAERYRSFDLLIDLGCSIGSDTLALSLVASTIGIDIDPLRLYIAWANSGALGRSERTKFLQADLNNDLPFSIDTSVSVGVFFDPARRIDGRRVYSVKDYVPPLKILSKWLNDYPAIGVKISPGIDLFEVSEYTAEVEFISLRGDLKEAVLWFGPLRSASRRATLLPGPYMLACDLTVAEIARRKLPLSQPRAWIYEPDPAVIRAGLVYDLGQQISADQLDPDIAYLTLDKYAPTPFAKAWKVEDWFRFSLKRLRTYLRERRVGRVTVKKRGSPLQPETLIRDLRLKGDEEKVLILTHYVGTPIVIICAPPQDACDNNMGEL